MTMTLAPTLTLTLTLTLRSVGWSGLERTVRFFFGAKLWPARRATHTHLIESSLRKV